MPDIGVELDLLPFTEIRNIFPIESHEKKFVNITRAKIAEQ